MISQMKKIFPFVVLFLVLMSSFAFAKERQSYQIACLPVLNRTGSWFSYDRNNAAAIMQRLNHEVYVPLNQTMQWVSYVAPEISGKIFHEEWQKAWDIRFANVPKKKAKLKRKERGEFYHEVLKNTAQNLPADLILCVEVNGFFQRFFETWEEGTCVEAVSELTLYVYDAKLDKLQKKSLSRYVREAYNGNNDALGLSMEILDLLLEEIPVQKKIFPLSQHLQ